MKKPFPEYAENIKMMDGPATPIFQQAKKLDKVQKKAKSNKLCKQVENLHMMSMKQPKQAPKQAEPMWYKCGRNGS